MRAQQAALVKAVIGLAVLIGIAGCGSEDPPSPPIARVGDAAISQAAFHETLSADEAAYARNRGAAGKQFFAPPDFPVCVKDEKRSGVGGRTATPSQLRRRCEDRYASFKRGTLDGMIEREWLRQAADARGIEVPAASEFDLLKAKVITRGVEGTTHPPSAAEIKRYYDAHRSNLIQPERRDALGFTAATRGAAASGKRELEAGHAWGEVARRHAISKMPDRLVDKTRGDLDALLGDAMFLAPRNSIRGPLDTQNGWYVLQVVRIQPAFQMSLQQSAATIKDFLATNKRRIAHYAFMARFRQQWRLKTRCVGTLRASRCRNGPRGSDVETVSHQDQLERPLLPPIRTDSGS